MEGDGGGSDPGSRGRNRFMRREAGAGMPLVLGAPLLGDSCEVIPGLSALCPSPVASG